MGRMQNESSAKPMITVDIFIMLSMKKLLFSFLFVHISISILILQLQFNQYNNRIIQALTLIRDGNKLYWLTEPYICT